MSEEFKPYLATINLKVVELKEAEIFYNLLFCDCFDAKKESSEGFLAYWGPVGLMISEQKDIVTNPEPDFRLGFTKISIRVESKAKVKEIYNRVTKENYSVNWDPKSFDYSKDYFSTCLFDPDYNQIEIFYTS